MRHWVVSIFLIIGCVCASSVYAATPAFPVVTLSSQGGAENYSLTMQALFLVTVLAFLPAVLLMMTSFTRIIIVLVILRQAMGMPTTPTNQILVGLALFLSFFVMSPVLEKVNTAALQPYMAKKMDMQTALKKAQDPIRSFMLNQTRKADLKLFTKLSGKKVKHIDEIPMSVLMPAFVTSELKTAFEIGFLIFIPFLIIDLVVASVLMGMGMMMLSPLIISLPFKIMLFVLVDGWNLILGTLASSFKI